MKVKELKEILENVDPELDVYVWDYFNEAYTEATFAKVEEMYKLDEDGEHVYDEDEEPVMFDTFTITN